MPESVKWGKGKQAEISEWLFQEITQALRERDPLERRWRKWLDLYRATANQPFKHFPFEGAHNYMLPSLATTADQMLAVFMQTVHAPGNIWTLKDLNERWTKVKKPMQDFLEAVDSRLLHMWDVDYRVMSEMVKLGTGIYKTGWLYERRKIQGYDDQGRRVKQDLLRTQPFVDHVRLSDFLMPTYSYAIQADAQGGAPWVAERHRLSPWQFDQMAISSGDFLPAFDPALAAQVKMYVERQQTDYQQKVVTQQYAQTPFSGTFSQWDKATLPDNTPSNAGAARIRELEIWECHARCETEPGQLNDIIVWFHVPTRSILRAVYADWLSSERPYDVSRYIRTEGFYGIGVCEQGEVFQSATSDLMNFWLDNMVLGNSIMLGARQGSNVAPGEPIYPGKIWITDGNPREDFLPMQLGQPNPSIAQAFEVFQSLGEKRTGVSDIQLGQMQDLPGRTPATTMLSLLQEGKRRPDLTLKDLRNQGLSNVGLKVLQAIQQQIARPQSEAGKLWLNWAVDLLGMPEGALVSEKLMTPAENVAFGLGVELTATSSTANKEVEKQSYTALMQIAGQTAQKILSFQQMAFQAPPLAPVAIAASKGLLELFTRLLEQYDIRNIEDIVPVGAPAAAPPVAPGVPPASAGVGGPGGPAASPVGGNAALGGVPAGAGIPMGA